jgi:hypothetical protein
MTKTEKRNRRFGGMSPAEQRVAIARDALSWLKARALIAQKGFYTKRLEAPTGPLKSNVQLREQTLGRCQVCGIGALFLAKAVRFNDVTGWDYLMGNPRDKLKRHFSLDQLDMIEVAFEQDVYSWIRAKDATALNKAKTFAPREGDPGARLTAILKNIIANNGTFVP